MLLGTKVNWLQFEVKSQRSKSVADPGEVRWVRTNPPPAGCGGWKR